MADPVEPVAKLPFDPGPWSARLMAAREHAKQRVTEGRKHLKAYLQRVSKSDAEVVVPHDFFYTEQKVSQLWYQPPEVFLKAENPHAESAAPLFAAVLNQKVLTDKGVKPQVVMDALVFDVVCPTGFGACKIGYESHKRQIPDPNWVAPEVPLPPEGFIASAVDRVRQFIAPPEPPAPPMVDVVVSERYYADRIPPGRLLWGMEWLGGDIDDASWVAYDRWENVDLAAGGPGTTGSGANLERETLLDDGPRTVTRMEPRRRVTECWYRAYEFDPTAHPDQIRMFEWAEGDMEPRRHEDSPYQTQLANGKLGGMKGYPIAMLTVRTVSDMPIPPSDRAITRNTIDELSVGRTQLVQRRDRAMPQTYVNGSAQGAEFRAKVEQNVNTSFIFGDKPMSDGDIVPIDKGTFPRENLEFQTVAERDLDRATGLGPNQTGTRGRGAPTATEMTLIQANTDNLLDKQRAKAVAFYCDKFVPKTAALVQMFHTEQDWVEVLGDDGVPAFQAYSSANLQGGFLFTVQAGASLRHDANAERKRWLDLYNLTANDPYINRKEISRNLCKSYGLDPRKVIVDPPPAQPEKPKVSVSIKIEDFAGPAGHIAVKIYNGEPVTEEDMQTLANTQSLMADAALTGVEAGAEAQAEHGGPAQGAEPISKHPLDITDQLPGGGSLVAQNAGTIQ